MPETKLNIDLGDDVETILNRLNETIAWCLPHVRPDDPRGCFRTMALSPNPFAANRKSLIAEVAQLREQALGRPPGQAAVDLRQGRLLIYEPDMNLAQGLEESETNGFVNVNNIPPWDTWVAYVYEGRSNYLLSWVPAQFINLVSSGINVSAEECFRWLDKTDFVLRSELHMRGLL